MKKGNKNKNYMAVITVALALLLCACGGEKSGWSDAQAEDSIEGYENFLRNYPKSEFAIQAKARLDELVYLELKKSFTTIEGEIERTVGLESTENFGEFRALPQTETLITSSGKKYALIRVPGCRVKEKPQPPGLIQLGSVGTYRCSGIFKDDNLQAYEIERLD